MTARGGDGDDVITVLEIDAIIREGGDDEDVGAGKRLCTPGDNVRIGRQNKFTLNQRQLFFFRWGEQAEVPGRQEV